MVLAAGMGLTMAPATESIMGSLPTEKAGVGSAVNDTTRELGGALGVAVLGSVLSSVFASKMSDAVSGVELPPKAADAAQDSIGGALGVAASIGGRRRACRGDRGEVGVRRRSAHHHASSPPASLRSAR